MLRRRQLLDAFESSHNLDAQLPIGALEGFEAHQLIETDMKRFGKAHRHLRGQPQLADLVVGHQRLDDADAPGEIGLREAPKQMGSVAAWQCRII